MNTDIIAEKIVKGFKDAYHLSIVMLGGDFTNLSPEYLLTGSVALALSEGAAQNGYLIKVEEPTIEFASKCVPQHDQMFKKFAEKKNVPRVGRIDIALYENKLSSTSWFRHKVVCPIEIKGVNPSVGEFNKDIERNICYFRLEDLNTGKSELELALFATSFYFEKIQFNSEVGCFREKVEKKVEKWMKKFKGTLDESQLKYEILIEEIGKTLYDEDDEGLDSDLISDSHIYFSVIVSLKRA